jgi:hypothetical protein
MVYLYNTAAGRSPEMPTVTYKRAQTVIVVDFVDADLIAGILRDAADDAKSGATHYGADHDYVVKLLDRIVANLEI